MIRRLFSWQLIVMMTFFCQSQNVVPIFQAPIDTPNNTYYKDLDNDFNPYVGKWKWSEGSNSLTIVFDKVVMVPDGNDYEDLLVGAYIYVERNTERVNTFPLAKDLKKINNNHIINLLITDKIKPFMPTCPECPKNVRYITLSITEPKASGVYGKACMVYFVDDGIEKIRIRFWNAYNENLRADYNGPMYLAIPEMSLFTLTKQLP